MENGIKNKEEIIRDLKVARAKLAIEIERKTAQVKTRDKLIENLRNELSIIANKLRTEVIKKKELNNSLEVSIIKHKKLSQNIEDLSRRTILQKIKGEFNNIDWFREINLLNPEPIS